MEKIGDTRTTLTDHPRRSETQACRYGRIHSQRRQPLFQSYLSELLLGGGVENRRHSDEKRWRRAEIERTVKIQKIHIVGILRMYFGYSLPVVRYGNTKIMLLSTN